jgi:hypothetical protein
MARGGAENGRTTGTLGKLLLRLFVAVIVAASALGLLKRNRPEQAFCGPKELRRERPPRWSFTLLAVGTLAAGYMCFRASRAVPDVLKIQFNGTEVGLRTLVDGPALRSHLLWDSGFLVFLAAALLGFARAVLWPMIVPATRSMGAPPSKDIRPHLPGWARVIAAWPLVADAIENILLFSVSAGHYSLAKWVQLASSVKWLGYVVLVCAVVGSVVRRVSSPQSPPPPPQREVVQAMPPTLRGVGRQATVGIACSGGGIRSATFSLGGLHALGPRRVRNANYLSGVSGGAYIAAAMTNVERKRTTKDPGPLPFGPGSDELKLLRARSSFLFLAGGDARIGFFRAFASIVFNLIVLWLVVFLVGRPVGWIATVNALHPELRARTPIVGSVFLKDDLRTRGSNGGEPVDGGNLDVREGPGGGCPSGEDQGRRFFIRLRSLEPLTVAFAAKSSDHHSTTSELPLLQRDGEVRVCGAKIEISAQPALEVDQSSLAAYDSRPGDPGAPPILVVSRPLRLGVRRGGTVVDGASAIPPAQGGPSDATLEGQIGRALVVDQQPAFTHNTGAGGRKKIAIEGWMWVATLAPLVAALLLVTLLQVGSTLELRPATPFLVCSALIGGITIVVPWLLQSLPALVAAGARVIPGAPNVGTGNTGGLVVWVSALAAAGQAARRLTTKRISGGPRARTASLLLTKAVVFTLLCLAGVALAFRVMQLAAMNGPRGRIGGLGAYWWAPSWAQLSDLARWSLVLAVLVMLNYCLPTHRWSLLPLYRDRLAHAFQLEKALLLEGRRPAPSELATFTEQRCIPKWPELVVCATANLNDIDPQNTLPAGRWADSFTFSPTYIGGPTIGYMKTDDYENAVSESIKKDLSLASVVAVAGAAFSPAMGKFAYGSIGGLFAVLDLRLGLWLPQPSWVAANPERWRRRPGWPYLLSELFGRYKRTKPFVYTTDGGHWENLGLVELLRRGCTEIYVLSAAGDGIESFSTIGEAIALAREQINVDIHVDLSPLRPPVSPEVGARPNRGPGGRVLRQLLRKRDGRLASEPFAPAPGAVGWFEYPAASDNEPRVRGRILFVEANLVSGLPWDVQSWAESQSVFPDDPTSDQFFNHRQFESYRRLGMYQVKTALDSEDWDAAGRWVRGHISEAKLRQLLFGEEARA